MHHQKQVAETRRLFDLMARGTTDLAPEIWREPVAVYANPDYAARERDVLFRGRPLAVAMTAELPRPGDFLTDDLGPAPLLLTRTVSGEVKAFLNVCRHRGARVAEGKGSNKRRFVCPYHAWTYDNEGRLVGIPEQAAFEGLDCASHGLTPLPVVERHGIIYVHFDPKAKIDAESVLGPLDAEMAAYNFAGFHFHERRTMTVPINWKLVVDGFLEGYHLPSLHKKTVDPIFLSRHCAVDIYGDNVRMIIPRRSFPEMQGQPEQSWDLIRHTAIIYVLFPNTVIVVQGDHIETWHCYPSGGKVDECTFHLGFYVPEPAMTPSAHEHWRRNMDLVIATVLNEDIPTSRGIQTGATSGAQTHVVFGRNEAALIAYHRALRDAMAA